MNQLTHPFNMVLIGTRTPGATPGADTGVPVDPDCSPEEGGRRTSGRTRRGSYRAGKVPFTLFIF